MTGTVTGAPFTTIGFATIRAVASVLIDDIRTRHTHFERQPGAAVQHAAQLPAAEHPSSADSHRCRTCLPLPNGSSYRAADVEAVADIEVVVAAIEREVRTDSCVVLASFEPPVLPMLWAQVHCEPSVRPLLKRRFSVVCMRIVVICSAAGLVVDLGEAVAELRGSAMPAPVVGFMVDADDAVRPAAQEQVAALAADVRHRQHRFDRQFLLHGSRVGENPLGNRVSGVDKRAAGSRGSGR